MIKEILRYSISNLWQRRRRSLLTILSILIGITAIFALSSFGLGLQHLMEEIAKTMGTDKIMMMPKDYMTALDKSNVRFTEEDLDFLRKINGVEEATGMIMCSSKVKFKDYKEKYPYVMGMSTEPKEERLAEEMFAGYGIEKGRALKKGDVLKATLGYNYLVPDRIFKKPVSLGDKIEINNVKVEVVGFYEEIGNPSDDMNVYISLEGYKEIFEEEDYFFILLRAAPDQDATALADKIKERFRKYKGQKEGQEEFFAQTYVQMMESYDAALNVLIGILVLIALVSVVVAAVNIMNTMYTSILERTREIGIMKSVGARNRFILLVFITESGVLGLIGGLIGLGVGYLIAKTGGLIAIASGVSMLQPYFPYWLVIGCIFFAFFVGAIAGLLPAYQASQLKPVDALRYE
ncbi:ABC transporter permease [Candidatus Woesearchaeota archaeon]|nr:ABC transporter permease [Candidatus Woesearchaeota archaeon]